MCVYSLEKDEIQTAPFDKVLLGSTAKRLLQILKERNIPVRLEAPNIKDISTWKGALLTSASRHVLHIESISVSQNQK